MAEGKSHGIFTSIAYGVAWLTALLGTAVGFFAVSQPGIGTEGTFIAGGIIISSWIMASGLGVIAEISRKLT